MKFQVRQLVILVAAFVALMLVSCNDDDSATSFDAGISQANICEEIAEVMCHNIHQCCPGKVREEKIGEELTTTQGECVDDMILRCEDVGAILIHAADDETVSIDMDAAKACVEALVKPDDASCVEIARENVVADLCLSEALVTGLVGKDDDCFFDFECDGDSFCDNEFACQPLPTEGEFCVPFGNGCAEHHMCDSSTNTCVALAAEGEDCNDTTACRSGLYCADFDPSDPATPGSCSEPLANGETCDADNICESGHCVPGYCNATTDLCYEDAACSNVCSGTAYECTDQTDCDGTCTGDATTICNIDADCTTAGGTCDIPECVVQTCEGGGYCDFSDLFEIDYCDEGLNAPCTVFGIPEFECSF